MDSDYYLATVDVKPNPSSCRFPICIFKTVQFVPESIESIDILENSDEIKTFYMSEDAVYYFDTDKNIYKYNPEGTRSEKTLLHEAENSDILLVNGADIKNTATSFISEDVPYFIAVNDSTFILFDKNDSKIKLLTAENN